MAASKDHPESIWDDLLSRQPARILSKFAQLSKEEQTEVSLHLRRMATEPDWHPEQRLSAQVAIGVIDERDFENGSWRISFSANIITNICHDVPSEKATAVERNIRKKQTSWCMRLL